MFSNLKSFIWLEALKTDRTVFKNHNWSFSFGKSWKIWRFLKKIADFLRFFRENLMTRFVIEGCDLSDVRWMKLILITAKRSTKFKKSWPRIWIWQVKRLLVLHTFDLKVNFHQFLLTYNLINCKNRNMFCMNFRTTCHHSLDFEHILYLYYSFKVV